MKKCTLLLIAILLISNAAVLAHGGKTHVLGTVTALDLNHVEVKTKEGQTGSILLSKDTKYYKADAAAVLSDLKLGDRVVIDLTGKGAKMTASEIRFASPKQAKSQEEKKPNSQKP
jgi:hypothetical protein